MITAFEAANFFIEAADRPDEESMTNLKLNKLLYYAQGCHLARTGEPLFTERIEAWQYGPVVPDVYHKYKVYGKSAIVVAEHSDPYRYSDDECETLLDVLREFGGYSGGRLIRDTHKEGTPWSNVYDGASAVIPHDEMRAYFTANPVPRFEPTGETVLVLPKSWYDPDEDAEWEAYL